MQCVKRGVIVCSERIGTEAPVDDTAEVTSMDLNEAKRLLWQHRARRNALLALGALLLLLFLIRSAAF